MLKLQPGRIGAVKKPIKSGFTQKRGAVKSEDPLRIPDADRRITKCLPVVTQQSYIRFMPSPIIEISQRFSCRRSLLEIGENMENRR